MKYLLIAILAATCLSASAAAVEFDTPHAHVLVLRPVDTWSPDASASEETLEAIQNKQASFEAYLGKNPAGKPRYANGSLVGLFPSVVNDPFVLKVQAELEQQGFHLMRAGKPTITIQEPVSVEPADMPTFVDLQARLFRNHVIAQGDPTTLESKVRTKKFLGTLLALGTMAIGVNQFGLSGGLNATLGSGISDDAYRIGAATKPALIPSTSIGTDFSKYKSIDVRRIKGSADRVGQVIIAYTEDKTPEAESQALMQAIVIAAGADTTPEEVGTARAEDFAARMAIWNACVAEGDARCRP